MNNYANENNTDNHRTDNSKTLTNKFFECKTKLIGNMPAGNNTLNTEVVVPSKYLRNFWRYPDLPLLNC